MTKKVTRREGDDETTSRGTVKGHHAQPGDDVTEGGMAPASTRHGHGTPEPAASRADAEGTDTGSGTSAATVGKAEKEHAAEAGAEKTQSGRGHRKHEAREHGE
jgi:hypothetical protein